VSENVTVMTTNNGHWNWLNLSQESAKWDNKILPFTVSLLLQLMNNFPLNGNFVMYPVQSPNVKSACYLLHAAILSKHYVSIHH